MHQALLIDEILRQIFGFCLERSQETLSSAARSCTTWKEPALDYLWIRLSSIEPLLKLIPGVTFLNGTYALEPTLNPDLTTFNTYARRVKHVSHRRSVHVHSSILSLLTLDKCAPISFGTWVLPSLATAQLSSSNSSTLQAHLSVSSKLQQLDFDLGFKVRAHFLPEESVCRYFEQVAQVALGLQRLSLRGSASKRLNSTISSMSKLRILSLRIGTSLDADTLNAAMLFPLLSELEIHAGHLQIEDIMPRCRDLHTFPSLEKLHVRAHSPVIELLLQHLQVDTLQTLRIEAEDAAHCYVAWSAVFQLICQKASNTLQNMTIEHHIDTDDLDQSNNDSNMDTTETSAGVRFIDVKAHNYLPFKTLQALRPLYNLRRIVLDTTVPSALCDQDIASLADWWPALEHLDLGSIPTPALFGQVLSSKLTIASLASLAIKSPKLQSLILPANLENIETTANAPAIPAQNSLQRLTVGFPNALDATQMALYLHRFFPYLMEVDGLPEQDDHWNKVQATLHDLRQKLHKEV